MEWYCIYDDHIEVRNIYGKINSVFYNNVSSVEEVEIYLYRGTKKKFYIFNDGRKNNGNIFDFIKWEDEAPWSIEDLKKLEVKDE